MRQSQSAPTPHSSRPPVHSSTCIREEATCHILLQRVKICALSVKSYQLLKGEAWLSVSSLEMIEMLIIKMAFRMTVMPILVSVISVRSAHLESV